MTPSASDPRFPDTRWTLVARVKSADQAVATRALEELCVQYHYPLYCYIRRRGLSHHDAQDALQDFLARLLRLETFAEADQQKGRLRAFLSTALQRYLMTLNTGRARRELVVMPSVEGMVRGSEDRYLLEQFRDDDTPDRVFDRKWAQALLLRVLDRLGTNYASRGKTDLFLTLKPVVLQGGSLRDQNPTALAASLGIKEGALRTALNRLLHDYRDVLNDEVRQTVAEAVDVEKELVHLLQIFE